MSNLDAGNFKKPLQSVFNFITPSEESPFMSNLLKHKPVVSKPSTQGQMKLPGLMEQVYQKPYRSPEHYAWAKERFEQVKAELRRRWAAQEGGLGKEAKSKDLIQLLEAKKLSDKNEYGKKNELISAVIKRSPKDFKIDSTLNKKFVGITHKPSGFRIHVPKTLIPIEVEKKASLLEVDSDDTIFDTLNKSSLHKWL